MACQASKTLTLVRINLTRCTIYHLYKVVKKGESIVLSLIPFDHWSSRSIAVSEKLLMISKPGHVINNKKRILKSKDSITVKTRMS